jgi:hypothetical protein
LGFSSIVNSKGFLFYLVASSTNIIFLLNSSLNYSKNQPQQKCTTSISNEYTSLTMTNIGTLPSLFVAKIDLTYKTEILIVQALISRV